MSEMGLGCVKGAPPDMTRIVMRLLLHGIVKAEGKKMFIRIKRAESFEHLQPHPHEDD
jgi:hypothetical protein